MTLSTQSPDFTAIKGRQQQTWASGDYHQIAAIIVPIAEQLADTLDLRAGESVLDVATGSGNAAIAAARRLTNVTGMDYVQSLLDRGKARASAEGLPVAFELGDAEALPVADGAYDVVLSTFGVMFAPNQAQAASELLRVSRPGGRIGLANWTPDGWIGEMLRTVGRHVAPPAGVRPGNTLGQRGGHPRAVRRRCRLAADDPRELRLALHLGRALPGAVPQLLRPGTQGLRCAG